MGQHGILDDMARNPEETVNTEVRENFFKIHDIQFVIIVVICHCCYFTWAFKTCWTGEGRIYPQPHPPLTRLSFLIATCLATLGKENKCKLQKSCYTLQSWVAT